MQATRFNKREKRAFENLKLAAEQLIGENEATLNEYPEDSETYKSAKEWLADHDRIVREVYANGVGSYYTKDGFAGSDPEAINDIKFCGKDWLMAMAEVVVTVAGY